MKHFFVLCENSAESASRDCLVRMTA